MGKIKYLNGIKELFRKSPVVNFSSIALNVQRLGGSRNYANLLVKKLVDKGDIKKIAKGYYTVHGDPSLAVFCFKPAYLGLQDALSFHNLWEQETIPVIITTRKVRPGIRKVIGTNVLVKRMDKQYFFGFELVKYYDFYLPISDVEKTFLDLLYFRQKLSKEVLDNFRKRIDKEKLKGYLKRYPKKMAKRVMMENCRSSS
ncbi:MAG: hypothetical protein AB1668_02815 [Nanoarchaeota archaeon]